MVVEKGKSAKTYKENIQSGLACIALITVIYCSKTRLLCMCTRKSVGSAKYKKATKTLNCTGENVGSSSSSLKEG